MLSFNTPTSGYTLGRGGVLRGVATRMHRPWPKNWVGLYVVVKALGLAELVFVRIDKSSADGSAELEFNLSSNKTLTIAVGTSFISHAQALTNLEREIGSKSFEDVVQEARLEWRSWLGRIKIQALDKVQHSVFYTNLWRSLLYPRHLEEEDEHGNMVPHKPEYVIFPHRNDCEREMGHSEYWTRVYEVSYDLDGNTTTVEDPKKYAVYDSDPDEQSNDATGIKIPVKEWNVDGEYQFQICLFGESDSVSKDTMDVGWGYSIERSGFSNWDYGYKCDNNIALPDICSASSAYYAHSAGRIEREMDSNDLDVDDQIDTKKSTPIDLLKAVDDANGIASDLGGSFGDSKNYIFGSGLYSVFSAHAQTVILAVLAVLSLTVFMCAFGLCKCDCKPRARRKGGKGGDLYGSVVDRLEEEDISDGTDSEEDHSDSDELIDH